MLKWESQSFPDGLPTSSTTAILPTTHCTLEEKKMEKMVLKVIPMILYSCVVIVKVVVIFSILIELVDINIVIILGVNSPWRIVYSKIKITSWITHPQAILGVYDFLLSDEYNRSYIKKCPGSSKLYNGSEWGLKCWSKLKCINPS